MAKVRITVTAVVEYELKPELYPEDKRTPEAMLEIDLSRVKADTLWFLDNIPDQWDFKGEVIP